MCVDDVLNVLNFRSQPCVQGMTRSTGSGSFDNSPVQPPALQPPARGTLRDEGTINPLYRMSVVSPATPGALFGLPSAQGTPAGPGPSTAAPAPFALPSAAHDTGRVEGGDAARQSSTNAARASLQAHSQSARSGRGRDLASAGSGVGSAFGTVVASSDATTRDEPRASYAGSALTRSLGGDAAEQGAGSTTGVGSAELSFFDESGSAVLGAGSVSGGLFGDTSAPARDSSGFLFGAAAGAGALFGAATSCSASGTGAPSRGATGSGGSGDDMLGGPASALFEGSGVHNAATRSAAAQTGAEARPLSSTTTQTPFAPGRAGGGGQVDVSGAQDARRAVPSSAMITSGYEGSPAESEASETSPLMPSNSAHARAAQEHDVAAPGGASAAGAPASRDEVISVRPIELPPASVPPEVPPVTSAAPAAQTAAPRLMIDLNRRLEKLAPEAPLSKGARQSQARTMQRLHCAPSARPEGLGHILHVAAQ